MNTREKLLKKFDDNKLKWRIQSAGVKDGKPWAKIMPYISARMVQERLDEVFGFDGWQTEFKDIGNGNVICKLSVWSEKRNCWITKEDGTSEDKDSSFQGDTFKSAISNSFKRVAANGFGIGRYLYDIKHEYAECSLDKKNGYEPQRTKTGNIYWKRKSYAKEPIQETIKQEQPIHKIPIHKIDGPRQVYDNGIYRELTPDELPMNRGFLTTLTNEIKKKYKDDADKMFQRLLSNHKVDTLDKLPLKVFKDLHNINFNVETHTQLKVI